MSAADRAGPPCQDEERGLEGVLRVLLVGQDAAADAEHERPVPADEGGERGLVADGGVPAEEFAVGQGIGPVLGQQAAEA